MIVAVAFQNTLPKTVDCVLTSELFVNKIDVVVSDYTTLDSTQTGITPTTELTLTSLPLDEFTAWRATLTPALNDKTAASIAASQGEEQDLYLQEYTHYFYCYCTNNLTDSKVAASPACAQDIEE